MKTLQSMSLMFAGLVFGCSAATADELISLKTRPDVVQSMLLWQPHPPEPEIVVLLIPGGSGNVGLGLKDGQAEATRPHLFSWNREALAPSRFAIVVVDAPSDQKDMDQEFRMSPKHSIDMTAVVREIRDRFAEARLVVMGHSRGTVSAGYVARSLGDQVDAVVLFSGLYLATQPGPRVPSPGPGLSGLDLASLQSPVLIVHHAKDACPVATFAAAQQLSERLPMITVNGNEETTAGSPCGPGSNHLFFGMERVVGEEVGKWLSGKEWQRDLP